MQKLYRTLILIGLFLFPIFANAESAQEQLAQTLNSITTLQANFLQTVYSGKKTVLQQTSGVMSLQRPGKFRWEVQRPSNQLLIADGRRVWFYDKGLQQVTVQKQQSENQNSPAMLLSGSIDELIQHFNVTELTSSQSEQRFKLTPRVKNSLFRSVTLDFQNNQLHAMHLVDSLGQSTVVMFSHVKNNPTFSQSVFHFVKPRGVDVVEG